MFRLLNPKFVSSPTFVLTPVLLGLRAIGGASLLVVERGNLPKMIRLVGAVCCNHPPASILRISELLLAIGDTLPLKEPLI